MVEISSILMLLIVVVVIAVVIVVIVVKSKNNFKYPNSVEQPSAFWLGGPQVGGWYSGGWPWVYPNY